MKVWILQTGEPLHIDAGNVRCMRAMNLSNCLVEAGHNVLLWSSTFYHQEKRQRSLMQKRIKVSDNLAIQLIPSRGYKQNIGVGRIIDHLQLAANLRKLLKRTNSIPDVAFVGYPPIESAAIMVRWLSMHKVPTLLDVKDEWPSVFLRPVPSAVRPLARLVLVPYFQLARWTIREATGISSMANSFLDWAIKFARRGQSEKDGVFPLTSHLGKVSEEQLEEARRWWDNHGIFDDGRPKVCFVGSHSSAFDFLPIKEAAHNAKNGQTSCDFIICGDGDSSHRLRQMFSDLSNVFFPGRIDRPKMVALAERSIAMLAPYVDTDDFRMSIPNKIIDALSLGLPILSTLGGEVRWLIEKYGVGMHYEGRLEGSLNECIGCLSGDSPLQKTMSINARRLYFDRFSYEKIYGGLAKHLEKLAEEKSNRRYLIYRTLRNSRKLTNAPLNKSYHIKVWTPKATSIAPKKLLSFTFVAWWLFHWLKVFKSSDYKIILVYTADEQLVHYTVLLPAHYRFPFMSESDLQIGPVDTISNHRRNGLAQYAINYVLRECEKTDRQFWYIARIENLPSLHLIERANFAKIGEGVKVRRGLTNLFSYFSVAENAANL